MFHSFHMFLFLGSSAANALKGIEQESSDSSDNESKDPYKLKDELAAVGKYKFNNRKKLNIFEDLFMEIKF